MGIFRILHAIRRLRANKRAVTAIEFALIGPLLLLYFCGFLLMCLDQFWQFALDDAVRNAARQMPVNAFNAANTSGTAPTGTTFVTAVCAEFNYVAPNCSTSLSYEVQTAATFSAITPATVSSSTGALSTSGGFPAFITPSSTTAGGQPLLFQVTYKPPFPLPPLLQNVLMTGNPSPSLVSAVAFMAY